jgi:hypothetical protein
LMTLGVFGWDYTRFETVLILTLIGCFRVERE